MDIATAQRALHRIGRVDRVLLKVPAYAFAGRVGAATARGAYPRESNCVAKAAQTDENRRMLAAFRWNLRMSELHRAGGRRVSDFQYDLGFGGAAAAGNRHRARSGREPRLMSRRIPRRGRLLRIGRRGCSASSLGRADGHGRGEADRRDGRNPSTSAAARRRLH